MNPKPLLLLPVLVLCLLAASSSRAGGASADTLRLELAAGKGRAYLREKLDVTVTLWVKEGQLREIGYPRLSGAGFSVGEFASPRQQELLREGERVTAYRFDATLTPSRSGRLVVGPAVLELDLLAPAGGSGGFFGETEAKRVQLVSDPLPLLVVPVPAAGRPAGFAGAVGNFTLSVSALPTRPALGDPVTVRTVIAGRSAEQFTCPALSPDGFRGFPPRRLPAADRLVCEQVLVPENDRATEIPAVEIAFFDPDRERFCSERSRPIPLMLRGVAEPPVLPAPAPPPPTAPAAETPAAATLPVLSLLLLAGGTLLVLRASRRGAQQSVPTASKTPATPVDAARVWIAAAQAAAEEEDFPGFYLACFRFFQEVAAGRSDIPARGFCGTLPQGSVSNERYADASDLLQRAFRVRYAGEEPSRAQLERDLALLLVLAPPPGGVAA